MHGMVAFFSKPSWGLCLPFAFSVANTPAVEYSQQGADLITLASASTRGPRTASVKVAGRGMCRKDRTVTPHSTSALHLRALYFAGSGASYDRRCYYSRAILNKS